MNSLHTIWDGLDWSVLTDILVSVIPALVCITLHELAHGFVAYKLGDNTAKEQGRLSFNPIRHIDIMGLLMMIVFKFGWAKPVPVNMTNFKNPKKGMAVTALAGPVCNLLLCCVFLIIYGFIFYPLTKNGGTVAELVLEMVATASYLSLAYAVFNIIPIPPLDGSKVFFSVLGDSAYYKLMRYERYGMLILFAIVATGILGRPLATVTGYIYDKLFVLAELCFDLEMKLV